MKTLKFLIDKFWIRKDRERYFLIGVILTSLIACFVSAYWHYSDMVHNAPNIKMTKKTISKSAEAKKLKETQFYTPTLRRGATRYYKMEEETAIPKIPNLKDYDGN